MDAKGTIKGRPMNNERTLALQYFHLAIMRPSHLAALLRSFPVLPRMVLVNRRIYTSLAAAHDAGELKDTTESALHRFRATMLKTGQVRINGTLCALANARNLTMLPVEGIGQLTAEIALATPLPEMRPFKIRENANRKAAKVLSWEKARALGLKTFRDLKA